MENREFEAIYQEYAPLVLRYLLRLGCPPQDAEDLIQDTFVSALLSIDSFRGDCRLSVWLCQIAKNKFYSSLARSRRELTGQAAEPADARDDQAWLEWLDLMEGLPEPYRTVFWKREVEGRSYAHIGGLYGKTENWARVTFFRARQKMQALLGPYLKEGRS